jgi:flagellar hook-associated protein 1 FlgK
MTLSVGLGIAQSSLSVSAEQTSVVSRNIANQGIPFASRKFANVVSIPGGGVRTVSITRATNEALFRSVLTTTSGAAGQKSLVDALDQLDRTINDPELDASPAALIGKLSTALQHYAEDPSDTVRARTALAAAQGLALGLNSATQTVQGVRLQADQDMAASVESLNSLLAQFETLNNTIVKGTRSGSDVTDQLDQRDAVLAKISEEIGIRTVSRADGDLVIYTDSGVTLFEGSARSVTFQKTNAFSPGTTGNAVYIDGVAVTGATATMPASSGRLVGLSQVRDSVAVTYQSQLDEIARGLVEAFAESDQSGAALPDVPGLFTYSGAPAMPASGTLLVGLAGSIRINAAVDPAQGGNVNLLRDGGIGGAAYKYNTTNASGFSDRLQLLVDEMQESRAFDPSVQGRPDASLAGFASSSVGWLQQARNAANSQAEYKNTLLERSSEALSKVTGVNIDEEMTTLLELERTYQASSKLISMVDGMFQALLSAVR